MGSLSEASISCEISSRQCITNDGNVYISKCKFPFKHNNRIYGGCTNIDVPSGNTSLLFCATEVNSNGEMIDGKWGYCNEFCPYCTGSDISTLTKKIEKKYENLDSEDCLKCSSKVKG